MHYYYNIADFITARRSYASAVLGIVILSVRLFVCPSLTRVLCYETKKNIQLKFLHGMKG